MQVISRQNAIDALKEFRVAEKIIAGLHASVIERWDGTVPSAAGFSGDEIDQYTIARNHLLKSLSLNMFFPDTHWKLATAYEDIDQDMENALQYYNSCVELDPYNDQVIAERMSVLLQRGDTVAAERDLLSLENLGSPLVKSMRECFEGAR